MPLGAIDTNIVLVRSLKTRRICHRKTYSCGLQGQYPHLQQKGECKMKKEQSKLERSLFAALRQKARELFISEAVVSETVSQVLQLAAVADLSKKMMQRVGVALLHDNGHIFAPACPDYTHNNGVYTFRGVGGGVSLLAQLHIEFLKRVSAIIPNCRVTILIADHEADDEALCQAVGKTREEFAALIDQSIGQTRAVIQSLGWEAEAMTTVIPDLVAREKTNMDLIRTDPRLKFRINNDMAARITMYRRINPRFSLADMTERTIKTAAQYLAMGTIAAECQLIVCNHSTVNLCWYKEAGAAVLHNPVSVY